jgi:hypothetical protein
MLYNSLFFAQPEADENPEGGGAGEGAAIDGQDAPMETFAWGASAAVMTRNDAKAEVSVTRVLEANDVEIPERVQIPHQSEVRACKCERARIGLLLSS